MKGNAYLFQTSQLVRRFRSYYFNFLKLCL